MASGYLGEFDVELSGSPFENYGPNEWAMYFITNYGGFDGSHHKNWVLDHIARILLGTPVYVREARWESGSREYRVSLGEPSARYHQWVASIISDGFEYDVGIPP